MQSDKYILLIALVAFTYEFCQLWKRIIQPISISVLIFPLIETDSILT